MCGEIKMFDTVMCVYLCLLMLCFAVDFLQVFDRTIFVLFPLAPLLTALLALIGQCLYAN